MSDHRNKEEEEVDEEIGLNESRVEPPKNFLNKSYTPAHFPGESKGKELHPGMRLQSTNNFPSDTWWCSICGHKNAAGIRKWQCTNKIVKYDGKRVDPSLPKSCSPYRCHGLAANALKDPEEIKKVEKASITTQNETKEDCHQQRAIWEKNHPGEDLEQKWESTEFVKEDEPNKQESSYGY